MPNPQQPELRRSENVPALSPDAAAAEVEARENASLSSQQNHRPPRDDQGPDQDQPDLDDVADAHGVDDRSDR